MARDKIQELKLEIGQIGLEKDVLKEDLVKLIDRERNLTDRLLDRHLGSSSQAQVRNPDLQAIGSRGGRWGPKQVEYERVKRDEARKEADAKKAHWDRKVAEIDVNEKSNSSVGND